MRKILKATLLALPLGWLAATPVWAEPPKSDGKVPAIAVSAEDYTLGAKDAPVTVLEYASLTCPHCAAFHRDTLPRLKSEYVDKGKVRLVYRDFPLNRLALTAAVVARCGGRDRFFGFIDTLFQSQAQWATAGNPIMALERIGRLGGISKSDFEACLQNRGLADSALQQRLTAERKFNVDSTPTVIINGERYSGGLTFEQIKQVIDPLLAKAGHSPNS